MSTDETLNTGRILIVEDNPAKMKRGVFLLTGAGHEVLQAVSVREGATLVKSGRPDLVLMDIELPGMDGLVADNDIPLHVDRVLAKPPKLREALALLCRPAATEPSA